MNMLLFGGALVAAVAYFVSLGKTANAAKNLITTFKKAQIYKFVDGGSLTVRVFVDFTNLQDTTVLIQAAYLKCVLDGITIGTCNIANVQIPTGTTSKYFDLVMPWSNLGVAAIAQVYKWFKNGTVTPPTACTITGQLKAENFIMNVDYNIPFSSTTTAN